jgi:DNA invertase Pin-like site-specific DNA recombinase
MLDSLPAAIYVRISRDREGRQIGVKNQEPPCRELAARLGWTVVRVFVDNDLTAYHERYRPQYEEMLAWVRDGRVRGIAAWTADRLTRKPRENEDLIDLAEAYEVQLATVTGPIDLATPQGRLHFRQLGIIARYESEHRAERIRLKQEELARAGRNGGGGTRPFGFAADRVTVIPEEAELLREAAERVLTGEGLQTVLVDWNARGVPTVSGTTWKPQVLRRQLLSPRIAGLREYQGIVVGPAVWPAIISREAHERLTVLLSDPVRQLNGGKLARSYLLTGFAYCGRGECGRKLVARPRDDKQRRYVCATGPRFGGCGKIHRLAEPVEALVCEQLFAALDSTDFAAALRAKAGEDTTEKKLLDALQADEQALADAQSAHFVEKILDRAGFLRVRQQLEERMEARRRELARLVGAHALTSFPTGGAEVRAAWDAAGLAWRRALLAIYIDRVILLPCVRGRNKFDSTKVKVIWRV